MFFKVNIELINYNMNKYTSKMGMNWLCEFQELTKAFSLHNLSLSVVVSARKYIIDAGYDVMALKSIVGRLVIVL